MQKQTQKQKIKRKRKHEEVKNERRVENVGYRNYCNEHCHHCHGSQIYEQVIISIVR